MLAFVFQTLASRKPDIDGGVYGYARAGFGVEPSILRRRNGTACSVRMSA